MPRTLVRIAPNPLEVSAALLFKELSESFHELGIPICEEGILELPAQADAGSKSKH